MKKRVSQMRAIALSFLICLILACNIILRMEASHSVSIGKLYLTYFFSIEVGLS